MKNSKKTKINKIEKLRQILDNPNDTQIKKSISKDEEILESIRRKISSKKSVSLDKKSDILKPKVTISTKKKIDKTKQIKVTSHKAEFQDKIKKEILTHDEEHFEVEKIGVPKSEILRIKSQEIVKETKTEEVDRKDKRVVFQEAEIDEIYEKTKRGLLSSDKIQMYQPITIIEMWVFVIVIGFVAISGLLLLRDWLFENFGIFGDKLIPTPVGTQNIHIWFGFALAVVGLLHLAIHIFSKKKDILSKKTLWDFKAFLHSGIYLIGLARRESYESSGRFNGRQKIVYLALVYILGLTIITGFLYYMNLISQDLAIVHIIPAGLSIMVLLFHLLITIRKHDTIALNCAFISGKIPRWYARKNHRTWYEKMRVERESTIKGWPHAIKAQMSKTLIEDGNKFTNAMFKFALLLNDRPDKEDIEAIAEELQATIHLEQLERIIELADQLEDETEEEDKPMSEEKHPQSEEE